MISGTVMDRFHPLIQEWFAERFGEPTPPQREGWPAIAAGQHTLIAAPTGSGKTLAAFMVSIDRLLRRWLNGRLRDEIDTIYVSPLRALSNDIERNLQQPLAEIGALVERERLGTLPIRTALRTGDSTSAERQAIVRKPPHLLVTTPESLYLLLTSPKGRQRLATTRTVIVDEIHALARDKRGAHLALTLERLAHVCNDQLTRIGLSATQKPIEQIAAFLVGAEASCLEPHSPLTCSSTLFDFGACDRETNQVAPDPSARIELDVACQETTISLAGSHSGAATAMLDTRAPQAAGQVSETPKACGLFPDASVELIPLSVAEEPAAQACTIVDCGHVRELDLAIEVPPSELSAVCTHEQWGEVYERLLELIAAHRSTLIFVNTRRLAERIAHALRELLGEDAVASHHGSLSKEIRKTTEERLKNGELKAIVATASLELGIDIGLIDLVCQIGSPRSIATFLQRIGRSGHSLGGTPKGRLFPLTRDELLESIALVRAVKARRLDAIEIPMQPLDILAQQIIAEVAQEEWTEDGLFARVRRAWPYRRLDRREFDEIVEMVSEGVNKANGRGAYVHRDRINGVLRGKRGARLAATTSGGAIPETAEYRVVTEGEKVVVGTVDEDFAIESTAGSVFLLGNNTWRVVGLRGGDMVVHDAQGQSPNVPFWFGEAPGRTVELSGEVSAIRIDIATQLQSAAPSPNGESSPAEIPSSVVKWLAEEGNVNDWGAYQASLYVASQVAAVGLVPTQQQIVFERFFDESGGTQLVIHAPLGSRITRAWGLALRKRFCRSFDFELQAAADDNGVVLSLGPQHSLPIENLFTMLLPENGQYLLEQAMLAVPFFQIRWRWNVTRALGVLRRQNGKKVPPHLQRFRSDDLLASAFPETVGCLENHHGDVEIPSHPLVTQTMRDCLFEATDVVRFVQTLQQIVDGDIELIARDTTEPSPFSHELLNANPYAFLDDAPLEERRSRAVATRRSLSPDQMRDLGQLDPEAIKTVRQQAWPLVRDTDELHDALLSLVLLDDVDAGPWRTWLDELIQAGRAASIRIDDSEPAIPLQSTAISADDRSDAAETTPSQPATTASRIFWFATERLPLIEAAYPTAIVTPDVQLPASLRRDVSRSEARVAIVRGYVSYSGPTSVDEIAELRLLDAAHIQSALEALEGEGTVMRGHFTDRLAGRGTLTPQGAPPLQWCERRLLSRIHQLTLSGLRKQIQPVSVDDYYAYILQAHQLTGNPSWSGPVGLREVVSKLEGYDIPAGAWEDQILAPRLAEYDPRWLDELFMAGELVWGRINIARAARRSSDDRVAAVDGQGDSQSRRGADPLRDSVRNAKSKRNSLSRNTPLSLMLRMDLPWLLPPQRDLADPEISTAVADVLDELRRGGAQFGQEIALACGRSPAEVNACLSELAASGHVTGDSFAIIRAAVSRRSKQRSRAHRSTRFGAEHRPATGRWSMFPPRCVPVTHEERLESWCHLLLRRYGIVFRELLTRESAAPRWFELQGMFRRMEMRGEIRGGRFVAGVGGEQFALADAIARVRDIRDQATTSDPIVISAADPLNLVGILDGQLARLTASHRNALLIRQGRCVAVRNGVDVEFLGSAPSKTQDDDRQRLLQFGLPQRATAVREQRMKLARRFN